MIIRLALRPIPGAPRVDPAFVQVKQERLVVPSQKRLPALSNATGSTLTLHIQQFRVVGAQVSSNIGWSGVLAPLCQNL
ncbi:MAG: hypothetical protein FJZ49_06685 [Candidatus Verstraetearchaeota archaeon]|nr:hypothetical protein [Candidatus Verstraetearchaeota archaeon]